MKGDAPAQVTELLLAWGRGDASAHSRLVPLVYGELRRLAHRYMRRERPGHTLQTTALVHEAYLRLVDSRHVRWQGRGHFFAVAAQLMRRILVDAARSRRRQKRGAGAVQLSLDEVSIVSCRHQPDLVALDDALGDLAALDGRKARVVELRFFGGLSVEETAEVVGVSAETVMRDWRFAKSWLLRELDRSAVPAQAESDRSRTTSKS